MSTILVTGAAGQLGRAVLPLLTPHAHVTALSRHSRPEGAGLTWVSHDLLNAAPPLGGVNTVLHLATNPLKAGQDERMTRHVVQAAQEAGVKHLIYMSIVGLERMQQTQYYAEKLRCEGVVRASRIPFTILRATQFHEFLDTLLNRLRVGPLQLVPSGVQLQPLPVQEVAFRLAELAGREPQGRVPDLSGPRVVNLVDVARRRGGPVVPVPMPLPLFRAWQGGKALP